MLRVLQFSPHDENCGVGKYQEQFVREVERTTEHTGVYTEFFDSSPYKTRIMSDTDLEKEIGRLGKRLIEGKFDILHIQHIESKDLLPR